MNIYQRKTDSLAYATGSFKTILEDVNLRWGDKTNKIIELGKQVNIDVSKALDSKKDSLSQKDDILSKLSSLGKLFSLMEIINKERMDLMIEMEGLDFPLKTLRKILILCKEEKQAMEMLENFASNLGKTVLFIENGKTEEELVSTSLNSFETAFNDFEELVNNGIQFNSHLNDELDKEHKKARKYLGIV